MAIATATTADFWLNSYWTCSNGRIVSGPTTDSKTKVFTISGIPAGAVIQSAVIVATYGSPLSGAEILRVNSTNVDVAAVGPQTVQLAPSITGNGDYSVVFEFKAYGDPTLSDGEHNGDVSVTGATVTVTYSTEPPPPPPEPEPDVDWHGSRPISVFSGDALQFNNNGLAVLTPLDGRLRMVAGGVSEITMRHPVDDSGKWRFLVPENIIRVPVPREKIENAFIGLDVDLYVTDGSAALREGMSEPYVIRYSEWSYTVPYQVGSRVTCTGWGNYQCLEYDPESQQAMVPPYNSVWWKKIADESDGAAVLVWLQNGAELYMIEDMENGWYKMSTPMGIEGYIKSDDVDYVRHITPAASDERVITDQLFRIKSVTMDSARMEINLSAEHVSYDLSAILIKDVSLSQAPPSTVISRVVNGLMMPYRGQIATNLTPAENGTYTGSFNGKNGTFAFLDPDNGIVSTFRSRFARDNWDLFVLQKTATDRGCRLRLGKNIVGVSWKRDPDSLVTRVVPIAKDKNGEELYLPELFVDSPHINDHPVVKMQRLSVKGQIGKDDGTGTDTAWTSETLYAEMRQKARERFTVDHADEIYQEITVDFAQLGDTAEHPWLKPLESVLLYDLVRVEDARLGLDAALTVTELEWNYIRKKITAVKLATAADYGLQTVAGYNIGNNSIGSEKLTEAAITEIARLLS